MPSDYVDNGMVDWKRRELPDDSPSTPDLPRLLRQLTDWPSDGFANKWFPGDYRLLVLTCTLPVDTDAEITCHSEPVSDTVVVRLTAKIRSKGISRHLDASELDSAIAKGFAASPDGHAVEARLPRALERIDSVAEAIRSVVDSVFGSYTGRVSFELNRGTRLDDLPVFQDIRLAELVSLLQAAGFEAGVVAGHSGPQEPPTVAVVADGVYPFRIHLREPQGSAFLTLVFSAVLDRAIRPGQIHALNSQLPVGAALIRDDGKLALRFQLCVSGGMGHAAIRDRVDEWVNSLRIASDFQIPPPAPAPRIM
jgi:hypothetical protein